MGLTDMIGDFFSDNNPISLLRQAQATGQARDEARQIRSSDIERDDKNLERNSISGRIQEGRKYGLSSLASLGASPSSGGTASVGQDTSYLNTQGSQNAMNSEDRTTARLGQDLLRQQIEGQRLANLGTAQDLQSKKTGLPSAGANFMPGGGQSIKGGITEKNMERTKSYPGSTFMEPGSITGLGFESTPTGLGPVPSSDIKERIEDSPYELRHFYRYGILPNFGDRSTRPPDALLPNDSSWKWSHSSQEWQIHDESRLKAMHRRAFPSHYEKGE